MPPHQNAAPVAAFERRRLLQATLVLAGLAVSGIPHTALAQPQAATKRFFDPARYAVLDAVAETIIPRTDTPGARDVEVPARFGAMMTSWASQATRTDFGRVLDEIEASAQSRFGRKIAALSSQDQLTVVAGYDTAQAANPAYRRFKGLVLALYYLSEPGATEELRYEHTPGAWQPSINVTPDTRAWAVASSAAGI
jgi:gluconate 2-dehydrogenase gamma chain